MPNTLHYILAKPVKWLICGHFEIFNVAPFPVKSFDSLVNIIDIAHLQFSFKDLVDTFFFPSK